MNDTRYPIVLDAPAVRRLLPHRGGILFVDNAELLARDHFRGSVRWRTDALGLAGHFPGCPLVPGVFLIEAAAQLAGVGLLAGSASSEPRLGLLAGTRACSFRSPVRAGETVRFDLRARRLGEVMVQITGSAQVGDEVAANFDLLLAHAPAAAMQSLLPGLRLPAETEALPC